MELYGICIFIGILFVYILNMLFFKYKNSTIDINELILVIYLGAFLGGKLVYLCIDSIYLFSLNELFFSTDLLLGGFSLLGASFFSIISVLYYIKKNDLSLILNSFLPASLLFLHSFGRLGCYFSGCCGGMFHEINLNYISIFFYLFAAIFGLILYFFDILESFYYGLLYYCFIIFLERFLFDKYRYDCIMINSVITKYQLFALLYLFFSILILSLFLKKPKR